ncbi:MAG TPA: tetratricopeptide repeat protein [Ktedonobacteraceae bacterium]|nr:tetratricopeptide repeat protein [Ktedonobacteraceae bacterium]
MNHGETIFPAYRSDMAGHVLVLEAHPGKARRSILQDWLQESECSSDVQTWLLSCDFNEGGAWAGLQDLLQDLVPSIQDHAPDLIAKHSYELCMAAPALQGFLPIKYPSLTDIAPDNERVRFYGLSRAYRSLHGLVDLLDAAHQLAPKKRWIIACDDYDKAQNLVRHFFAELMRRRGDQLQFTLLLAVAPGNGRESLELFASSLVTHTICLDLPAETVEEVPAAEMTSAARELERQVEQDPLVAAVALPRLIDLWQQSEFPEHALRWKIQAMSNFAKLGLYESSFVYCKDVEDSLDVLYAQQRNLYLQAVYAVYLCYLLVGNTEKAFRIVQEKLVNRLTVQPTLSHGHYLLAMLYARFLQPNNIAKAVEHLELGLSLLNEQELSGDQYYFFVVFLRNGLAYVRSRQRRPAEAIALCREGLQMLDHTLPPDRHKLHRSVLLYNIAQVYAATGPLEEALAFYSAAIAMDPNYPEYFDERGSLYLKAGQLQEAERDFLQAIELSPPYPEVWTNLGQCYRAMERWEDAVAAYARALDLDPRVTLALVGRADAHESLGHLPEALADYSQALILDPEQPTVFASRAVVYYELEKSELALADLNEAIRLSPQEALFYQNRATALISLGRPLEAAQDLQTYLHLQPNAEDRVEVEAQLAQLQAPILPN